MLGPTHRLETPSIRTPKSNPSSVGNIQRVVVRQSDIASHEVKSTTPIKLQQTTTNQPSSAPSGTQTKMISAADLQKLISSGAVKTVTRTSVIPQATASVSTPPTIRQAATNQQQIQQQVISSTHSDTANVIYLIRCFFALVDGLISTICMFYQVLNVGGRQIILSGRPPATSQSSSQIHMVGQSGNASSQPGTGKSPN